MQVCAPWATISSSALAPLAMNAASGEPLEVLAGQRLPSQQHVLTAGLGRAQSSRRSRAPQPPPLAARDGSPSICVAVLARRRISNPSSSTTSWMPPPRSASAIPDRESRRHLRGTHAEARVHASIAIASRQFGRGDARVAQLVEPELLIGMGLKAGDLPPSARARASARRRAGCPSCSMYRNGSATA